MFLLPTATPPTPSRIIAVPSDLISLAGDGNTTLFLAQVLFWWKAKGRQKFYKFNAPCTHALYRAGDSWQEELGLRRTMFMTARRRVAVKVRITCREAIQAAFDAGALVVYGTDEHHLTWYMVNEAALRHLSPAVHTRLLGSASASTPASNQYSHATWRTTPAKEVSYPTSPTAQLPATVPAPTNAFADLTTVDSEGRLSSFAEGESLHSPMQGSCTGITESPSQITSKPASDISLENPFPSKTIPLPATHVTATAGEEGTKRGTATADQSVTTAIITGLQARGVQAGPAWRIARRAVCAGWGVDRTLAVFEAHRLDAKQAGTKSPVGVAVSRMVKNEQISLPPANTLTRVQGLHQARAGEGSENAGSSHLAGWGGEGQGSQAAMGARDAETVPVALPLQTLWQKVLGDIKLQVTRATFEQRFKGTWLEEREGVYVVCSRDPYTVDWLAHRLKSLISETLARWGGAALSPRFACG